MSCVDEPCALFPGFPGCPGAESNKAEEGPERETVTHSPEDALPKQLIFIAVENPASAILDHAVLPGQMRVSFTEINLPEFGSIFSCSVQVACSACCFVEIYEKICPSSYIHLSACCKKLLN